MKIDVLTTFPEVFGPVLGASIVGRAREAGIVTIEVHDLRKWTGDRHRTTDDSPFGGGPGMVMKPEPFFEAVESLRCAAEAGCREEVVLLCPQGERFEQGTARGLAQKDHLILLCGHYEGVDERVREHLATRAISVGDYVLTGGEIPAMVVIDAVVRLLPGALGAEEGAEADSFAEGLLEHPQHTRPAEFRGWKVPEVLLSGNHEQIRRWRRKESLRRTKTVRPDLFEKAELTEEDRELLEEIEEEQRGSGSEAA
ncbi:MAG: tRNA (guanosine(37)-N1)-methyltransferase TrmD [Armatimonadota bacterium]|nr:MAG: tRNA (guanosine(37)-N1)-methyltransferase TrmD [Armatimonadota bacterium]